MIRSMAYSAVAALVTVSPVLATISVGTLPGGDAQFSLLTNAGTLERAVAEGRIGNNAANGTWERAIWEFGGVGGTKAEGQSAWTSGSLVDWTFAFDGVSTVTYTVGTSAISWNAVAGSFTDIFIRTRSARSDTTVALTELSLSGYGVLPDVISSGSGDVDYLRISSSTPFGAFSIGGKQKFEWSGSAPTNSALAYQVKFSNVVPTPGAAGVVVLLAGAGLRRRRA